MYSILNIAMLTALVFLLLQGQLSRMAEDRGEETKLQLITQYGDVAALRHFLEGHRHDVAVCYLCSSRMTEDSCNWSSSRERRDLCLDILRHCRAACMVA
jgi:hypothetical protein